MQRQVDYNNNEILENYNKIRFLKNNVAKAIEARQENMDPAIAAQLFNNQ